MRVFLYTVQQDRTQERKSQTTEKQASRWIPDAYRDEGHEEKEVEIDIRWHRHQPTDGPTQTCNKCDHVSNKDSGFLLFLLTIGVLVFSERPLFRTSHLESECTGSLFVLPMKIRAS